MAEHISSVLGAVFAIVVIILYVIDSRVTAFFSGVLVGVAVVWCYRDKMKRMLGEASK